MEYSLPLAKRHVTELLDLSNGNPDAVYRAIVRAEMASVEAGWDDHGVYGLQRLALAHITGDAGYRL